jgi:putative heme iron utilization protein
MKKIYKEYVDFLNNAKCVYISSILEYKGGQAVQASYSPCIVDEDKNIFILVSTLAQRTASLLQGNNVSVMFIEPEDQCKEIYVRTRLTFSCNTQTIDREMGFGYLLWDELVAQFTAKFGDIISTLVSLEDFKMVRFTPLRGTFVKGFGKAYSIRPSTLPGQKLDNISHINFNTGEKM